MFSMTQYMKHKRWRRKTVTIQKEKVFDQERAFTKDLGDGSSMLFRD